MSESQFENLIDDPPIVLVKKQLDLKINEIALLKQQVNNKSQQIQKAYQLKALFEQSCSEKEQTIKSLMSQTFKLSEKIIELSQKFEGQSESLETIQHEKKEMLESQVKEKQELIILIEELSEELKKELEQKGNLRENLTKLQNEINMMEKMFSEVKETLKRQNESLRRVYEDSQSQKANLRQEKEELRRENQEMKKIIEEKMLTIQEGKSKQISLERQNKECRQEIAQLGSQLNIIKQYSQEHLKLYQEAQKRLQTLENLKKQLEEKQKTIADLNQRLSHVRKDFDEAQNCKEHLKAQLKQKQTEMITLHLAVENLESQLTQTSRKQPEVTQDPKEVQKLKIKIKSLNEDIKEFEDTLKQVCEQNQAFRLENKTLKSHIEHLKLQQLQQNLQKLKTEIEQLDRKQQILTNETCKQCEHKQNEIKAHLEKIENLQGEIKWVIQDYEKFATENSLKDDQIKTLNSELASIKQSLKEKIVQIQKLKIENQSLNKFLSEELSGSKVKSIQEVYEDLESILFDIHENLSFSEGSEQQKVELERREKAKIQERIQGILYKMHKGGQKQKKLMEKRFDQQNGKKNGLLRPHKNTYNHFQ